MLIDAPRKTSGNTAQSDAEPYGGTGRSWDYSQVRELARGRRAFVAGGISADNVAALLEALPGLFAVDVCSGVERSPGEKDEQLLRRLFCEIEAASKRRDGRTRRDA